MSDLDRQEMVQGNGRGGARSPEDAAGSDGPAADGGGDDDDLGRYRLDTSYDESEGERVVVRIEVGRPRRDQWLRCHPDRAMVLDTLLLDDGSTRQSYLVEPSLRATLAGELVAKRLVPTITRAGGLHLWPIRLPDRDGRIDGWSESAHGAVRVARTDWVRVVADMAAGGYDVRRAVGEIPDPVWPELTLGEWVRIAFGGRTIDSLDHPVLRRLRGE